MCNSNFYWFAYNCLINNLTDELCGCIFICGESGKHQTLTILSNENSNKFLIKGVIITAEYSLVFLNAEEDIQSRRYSVKTVKNQNGKRKMKKNTVLQNIWKQKGVPDIDLFRSWISHQVASYMSWKIDPYIKKWDAFLVSYHHHIRFNICFPC